jgi:general secretion pathway protein D
MRPLTYVRLILAMCAAAAVLSGQASPRVFQPPPADQPQPQQAQPQQQPQQPAQQEPAQQPAQQPANAPGTPAAPGNPPAGRLTENGGFLLPNVSLTEMIDILAKRMKINYILDKGVVGSVTIYTYGEVKAVDLMPLLETILRVNNATIVQVGDLYRIVPINRVSQLPLPPMTDVDPKTLPDDERMILNLIFLKYATVGELAKLIQPFLGEGAQLSTYDPANLLLIQDNSRSMKRTMELIGMFDSDTFAGQRVRLFDVANSRPSDLVKDLDSVFKAYSFSEKSASVKFLPVDRINTIIAVAPNPGVFPQVKDWIEKLDVPAKTTAGAINNYVYRLKYGRAETVAMAIMALYTGNVSALMSLAAMSSMGGGMGIGGGIGMSGMGYGGMGGGYGGGYGGGMGGGYGGGYGAMGGGYGGAMGGGYGGGYGAMGGGYGGGYGGAYSGGVSPMGSTPANFNAAANNYPASTAAGANPMAAGLGNDLTGSYLGNNQGGTSGARIPHVIPNPFDNTLLIQGTPQEYEQINSLLRQLDVPPRQVLIEAKIYEVDLSGAFSAGVTSYLEQKDTGTISRVLNATAGAGGLGLSVGALVLRSHELLGVLQTSEATQNARVISAPSIIATDSIPATMNVGQSVPVLTSQAVVSGVTTGGTSPFANTVNNVSTGVTLAITARVNSSGVVTMIIDQQVSSPVSPSSDGIQSPSFSNRSFSTQLTVQDGDTVAIGGFIQETYSQSSSGVPFLHRIPILGAAFGSKSISKARTELIVFLTPRVIYDTNQITDATDEIRSSLKHIQKLDREQ